MCWSAFFPLFLRGDGLAQITSGVLLRFHDMWALRWTIVQPFQEFPGFVSEAVRWGCLPWPCYSTLRFKPDIQISAACWGFCSVPAKQALSSWPKSRCTSHKIGCTLGQVRSAENLYHVACARSLPYVGCLALVRWTLYIQEGYVPPTGPLLAVVDMTGIWLFRFCWLMILIR